MGIETINPYDINRKICEALGIDMRQVKSVTLFFDHKGPQVTVEYLLYDSQADAVAEVIRETGIKPTDDLRAAGRPTVEELEALLQGPDREVVVLPNGEVAVGAKKEIGFGTE